MSSNTTSCLATNQGGVADTEDIEQDFIREMRRRWRLVRGAVRRSVGYPTDAFGLVGKSERRTLANTSGPVTRNERIEGLAEPYDAQSQARLIDSFARDFEDWVEQGVLRRTAFSDVREGQHWTAEYVDDAYARGQRDATSRLQQAGVTGVTVPEDALGGAGVSETRLRRLYDRAYGDLEDISGHAVQAMREELTLGFAAGDNPRQLADRLTNRIRTLQRTRAETLARTHVAEAYNVSALDRYESAGVDTVRHGEFLATDDDRTCPICRALNGRTFALSNFRTETFDFSPSGDQPDSLAGSYPVRPPTHPRCRCTIVPVI